MKHLSVTALLFLAIAVSVAAQTKTVKPAASRNADDEAAIQGMLTVSGKGWSAGDAKLASSVYTEDAQWMNAFGRRKKIRVDLRQSAAWFSFPPTEPLLKFVNRIRAAQPS